MALHFDFTCRLCPGDGVVRAKRPGIDWPSPCFCNARRSFTQYSLARILEEDPKQIVRLHENRKLKPETASRLFAKLITILHDSTSNGIVPGLK